MDTPITDAEVDEIYHLTRLALTFGTIRRGVAHPDGHRETDTDHTVSLTWLACSLARSFYPDLDLGKIAVYASVHDAVEIYAGDTYAVTAGEAELAVKKHREEDALHRLAQELRELSWLPEMIYLYEQQADPEARFVRLADKLMPKLVLRIEGDPAMRLTAMGVTGTSLREFRAREDVLFEQHRDEFPELCELRTRLHADLRAEDLETGRGRPA
jgi:putative hydrolases of HD superfamily